MSSQPTHPFAVRSFTAIGVTEDYDVTSVGYSFSFIVPNLYSAETSAPIVRRNPFHVRLRPPDTYTVVSNWK